MVIEITEGKCMVCGKELQIPMVVCSKCSSTDQELLFEMLNQYIKEHQEK